MSVVYNLTLLIGEDYERNWDVLSFYWTKPIFIRLSVDLT